MTALLKRVSPQNKIFSINCIQNHYNNDVISMHLKTQKSWSAYIIACTLLCGAIFS